ncbi:Het-C-domain-containing protein [Dacryopinax primogenitus]|uniref:Het-C-domain-containing protein n=1 Tax=Dacryopinax primogenitus (strain DJM 731) TaxID=1858805 RepID=M5FW96_DACPD|nr:Het-C-domain-containing protein [Dacryopinax primogenitus]EJU02156.1 Het-C-domain-containing protein [Dacryopinax primogenitus]
MFTPRTTLLILLCLLILLAVLPHVHAFGAGNIPSYAYLEGKAFRHGDIEDVLSTLVKKAGGFLGRGTKFGGLDTKRVYFGNWLRDYSQAMDIAALKKLEKQTILNLVMALGFLAHGYATSEFEVTEERLGVYLPTEHIDNPKGYGGDEDPRKYHPALRPPVDQRELEIDERTGMKNYIGNENGNWDTSRALVRRTLEKCIAAGRQARSSGSKETEYEAFRLLGTALHTLEDFAAHSNFCELALVNLGHGEVFCHVGEHCRIRARNGKMVPPLVTGTFGGADFIHSLLGEATDHISEASVSDLTKGFDRARSQSGSASQDTLRSLFSQLPGGEGTKLTREMDGVQRMRAEGGVGGKKPEQMSPQELHAALWQVLKFRDGVMMYIEETLEKIPLLSSLIDKISNTVSVFVLTSIEPLMKPILKQATAGLQMGSSELVNSVDQFEVFNNPMASDPTHSFLSKDHFGLILNEPAGMLGKLVLTYTVNLVVQAWDNHGMDTRAVTEPVLESFFHPDFYDQRSQIQYQMMTFMKEWIQGQPNREEVIRRLTQNAVKNHENTRLHTGGSDTGLGHNMGIEAQHQLGSYVQSIPGVAQVQGAYNSFQRISGQVSQFTGGGARREVTDDAPPGAGVPSLNPPGTFPSHSFTEVTTTTISTGGFQEQFSPGYQHPEGRQPPQVTAPRPPASPRPQEHDYQQQHGQHQGGNYQPHHGDDHSPHQAQHQPSYAPPPGAPFPPPMGGYAGPAYAPPQGPPPGQWQGYPPPGPPPGQWGPPQGPPPGWQGPPGQGWSGYPGQGRW